MARADEDEDEDEAVDEGEDEDDGVPVLVVRRLSDLEGWELYRASHSVAWSLATIAILPPGEGRPMEYALFRNDAGASSMADEPLVKGRVDVAEEGVGWDDEARVEVLRAILTQTEDELGVGPIEVEIDVGGDAASLDEDEEEDETPD